MNTIDGMVTAVIAQLVQVRNMNPAVRPIYRRQADLMAAAGVTREHTFSEIVTKAALEVPSRVPGWVLVENQFEGYRLVTQATVRDLKRQLRKLRTARTILSRVGVVLSASGNSPMIQMIAASIIGLVSQVEIAIRALDKAIA